MANTFPVVPYKNPVVNQDRLLAPVWDVFFRELYARIGGTESQTLTQLTASVETLQTAVTSLSARVTELEGLGQGRQL